MKRERLVEVCDTTTTDTPSPLLYKRPRETERRPFKTEQLEEVNNNSPQNHQRWRHNIGKRRALDRDFATKLASITLTSADLTKLDAIYGGAYDDAQLEQFSRAVSGCLCRLGRHAVGQKSEVIAFIDAVVGPVDLHQMAFSQRRIFVFQLGYFEFDQIANQKPDLVDYGPWMADMDIQSLPLPSDEFINEKAQMLQSLFAFDASGQQIERDHFSKSQRLEKTSRGIDQDAADDDDDIEILDLETASSTVKTEASDARDFGDDEEEDEQLEDDANEVEEEMDEPPLDKLVHSIESLRRVRLMLCKVKKVPRMEAICDCLVGCLVVCHTKSGTANPVIVDEIIQVDGVKIIFKHSSTPYLISELADDFDITDNIFRHWIDNMARWGEQLPLSSLYHARRMKVYAKLKALKKSSKLSKNQRQKQRKREKLDGRAKARQQKANNEHETMGENRTNRDSSIEIQVSAFGSDIERIIVTPKHLVQILQRGRTEFERVAIGLYVRCRLSPRPIMGKKQQRLLCVEQIKQISWGAKPYAMYGEQLTVLLHFDHDCCPIIAVQFCRPEITKALVKQQELTANFISPSGEHIKRKCDELQAALRDTVRLTAHAFQRAKTDRK